MSKRTKFILLFLLLLALRTFFSFSKAFFSADEVQTFLIGLKFYSTGSWPYFGPDLIVTETGFYSQIPGALEGLVVGGPLYLLPVPEASLFFLNLLSLSGIAFLSLYIHKRLPKLPLWFIFTWTALLPWTLHESTSIYNPSYLLFGSCLFFVGFMEAVPALTLKWLSKPRASALMGFGLLWNMQFHFSWVLLPPFVAFALWSLRKNGRKDWMPALTGFSLGALPAAALLIPTLVKFGWSKVLGGGGTSHLFYWDNMLALFTILARYLSLSCFEILRFVCVGLQDTHWNFFKAAPWLYPPGIFLVLLGWVQPFLFLYFGWKFWKGKQRPVTLMALGTFLLIYVMFWFTTKEPLAHIYFIVFPVIAVYSFYVWEKLAAYPLLRKVAVLCLGANLWLAAGYAFLNWDKFPSLYSNRPAAARAVEEKNYHILGERRPGSIY